MSRPELGSTRPGRSFPRLLVAILLSLLVAVLWLRLAPEEALVSSGDVVPPGWWTRAPLVAAGEGGAGEGAARQHAQMLSLPYVAGSTVASGEGGIVHHVPAVAWQGVNLVVSGHAPEAILLGMDGRTLHRWHQPFEAAFPAEPPGIETWSFRRAHLLPDGGLLALYQGGGMVRLDRHSRVVWATPGSFFNDFDLTPDGRILVLEKRPVRHRLRPEETILEDHLAVLDPDSGEIRERRSLLAALLRSRPELLEPLPDHADILHSNTVTELRAGSPGVEPGDPIFAPGNLLVSFREIATVAVFDPDVEKVLWGRRGPWAKQHEPILLEGPRLLLFDNQGVPVPAGAPPQTRVLAWDPHAQNLVATFAPPGLSSPQAGTVAQLPNGNLLVVSSEQGRAFELRGFPTEPEVVWELVSPYRAGRNDELVATLFQVERLDPSVLEVFETE